MKLDTINTYLDDLWRLENDMQATINMDHPNAERDAYAMHEHHKMIIEDIKRRINTHNSGDTLCPVCGYYCLGKGGFGCINKPKSEG